MDSLPAVVPTAALTSTEKSSIRRIYDRIKAGGSSLEKAKLHTAAGAQALRQGGESLVLGALLGAADSELPTGLDITVKGHAIPADAALGLGCMIASTAWAQEGEISTTLRNAGGAALAVGGYRKVHQFMAERRRSQGKVPGSDAAKAGAVHGDFGADADPANDPILACASLL